MTDKFNLKVLNDTVCKHGLVREKTCDQAEPLLLSVGLPKLQPCSNCSMISSLETLNLSNKNTALAVLQHLGLHTASKSRTSEVVCPVHEQLIVSDCSLSDCKFYTTYPGVRNCILVYMNKHKVDHLESLDLSMILGIHHKDIIDITNKALQILRQDSVETTTTLELDPKFVVVNSPVCCNCEAPVDLVEPFDPSTFYHCSEACLSEKPLSIIKLEAAAGVSIDKVLVWARSKYANLLAFQQALGLDIVLLNILTVKYFGTELSNLYNIPVSEVLPPIIKRMGRLPTWLKSFSDKIQPFHDNIISIYGPVRLDFVSLQQELDSVL